MFSQKMNDPTKYSSSDCNVNFTRYAIPLLLSNVL